MNTRKEEPTLTLEKIGQESFYKISNHDQMEPFFMSIVSDGNHWMFISSNGGLTAGRKNASYALFPYYTDDKLTELADTTGSKTIFRITSKNNSRIWEPFSIRYADRFEISRNLYKSIYGNKIVFEEINHDLALIFRYQWSSSNQFGFVRQSTLINNAKTEQTIEVVDGIQNIMPHGVSEDLQGIRSNLVDAYKRSELDPSSGVGIFALSAIIVDRAEPSEALKANVAWSQGFMEPNYLLSSVQLDAFREGHAITTEHDVKARKGAYFVNQKIQLPPEEEKSWWILSNVNQGPSDVVALIEKIKNSKDELVSEIVQDIQSGTDNLVHLVAAADGIQLTADDRINVRHYSNTLFNIMRGGIFDHNYQIEKQDFIQYLKNANRSVYRANTDTINELPAVFDYHRLKQLANNSKDSDLGRLTIEYLPLKFSRRHGDPSRPWNKFSINTRNEIDGSKILDYEGNWRDIFQNWEALAHSYPEFIDGMIYKFLNASTFDGYNPYRVTKGGFDWEVIEEHDPWSYIGYWGDHQIIYLLKFLEFAQDFYPGKLQEYFQTERFVYANVPYKIKPYDQILANPKDTIAFDHQLDHKVRQRRDELGADGSLLINSQGQIHRVNFMEKILATVLAKLSNYIPEGGIWLNTQRPEWNDANNALVGNGVSMVTLYYLRRFLHFFERLVGEQREASQLEISSELKVFFDAVKKTFDSHLKVLEGPIDNASRKTILDELGTAGSNYRNQIYDVGFSGSKESISTQDIAAFISSVNKHLEHAIRANVRADGMYHAYNLMTVEDDNTVSISYLDPMLEGQVAVLSSGYLTVNESLTVLNAMKSSGLFRPDQYSYLLYPNKELKGFLDKNIVSSNQVNSSVLLTRLITDGNKSIIEQDVRGKFHFNGSFNNADSLKAALNSLPEEYGELIKHDSKRVFEIFEEVFNHKAFTGRSGTFYGYEGLGSIYWHMVSKLGLAVEETCLHAVENSVDAALVGKLLDHYYEINAGVGVHKSPKLYGAFPVDPYSHTPGGKGAQQPGMTGQVKEDILSRMGELGLSVKQGCIHFNPVLLRKSEFLKEARAFTWIDLLGNTKTMTIQSDQLAFTMCQVPVIYEKAESGRIELTFSDGKTVPMNQLFLDAELSVMIFKRLGEINKIKVHIPKAILK